jgi:hypothetical protein
MKNKLTLLLVLFLSGCSSLYGFKKHKGIDSEFQPYMSEIIEFSQGSIKQSQLKYLTIGFSDLESPVVGRCSLITKEIDIDRKFWKYSSYQRRMETLMHEIGHCVLYRYHTDTKDDIFHDFFIDIGIFKAQNDLWDGCPSSIMHPYEVGLYCFNKHYIYYIEEFFGRADTESYRSILWRKD